jgi:hypothetical protein
VHAPSQPLVGCTAHSRRTAQIGNCGGAIHGGQIFASATQTAFPNLANLPDKSSGADRGHRFFHRADGDFPGLFVFVVLAHERRRVVHFAVTEHPTQEWNMQQVREAFPWDQAPRFCLRDRDAIYGRDFAAMTREMGMEEVLTAPRSPGKIPLRNG